MSYPYCSGETKTRKETKVRVVTDGVDGVFHRAREQLIAII